MRYLVGLLLFGMSRLLCPAAELSGRVTDTNNQPISGALVLCTTTGKYTISNEEGNYQLQISDEATQLAFSFIEYQTQLVEVPAQQSMQTMDVRLIKNTNQLLATQSQEKSIAEANRLIQMAQSKRKQFLKELNPSSYTAFIKSSEQEQKPNNRPYSLVRRFKNPESDKMLAHNFVNESEIKVKRYAHNELQYLVIKGNNCIVNNALIKHEQFADVAFNLYQAVFRTALFSEFGFVSPLAPNAFHFYTFRLEGIFNEQNQAICKIRVIPKRNAIGTYSGHIYLVQNTGRIYAVDIYLNKFSGLQKLDSLHIQQNFVYRNDSLCLPYLLNLNYKQQHNNEIKEGNFKVFYTNYSFDSITQKRSDKAQIVISNAAQSTASLQRSQAFLVSKQEKDDYYLHHEIDSISTTNSYIDSLDKRSNELRLSHLLDGYTFTKTKKRYSIYIEPLYNFISFNTVQGLVLNPTVLFTKNLKHYTRFELAGTGGYGLANKKYFGYGRTAYYFNTTRFAKLELNAGKDVLQFNSNAISPLINTLYTLLVKDNFMKLFEKHYAQINVQYELINGLLLFAATEYADRNPLRNTTDFSFIKSSKEFSSNDPQLKENDGFAFFRNQSFHVQGALQLSPFQKYYIDRAGNKLIRTSNYPSFTVFYKKAFKNVAGSDVDLDLLKLGMEGTWQWMRLGKFHYLLEGGKFVNRTDMTFMDWKYFNGNKTLYSNFSGKQFQLLDYYGSSANNSYLELHLEQNFKSSLSAKIPLLRTAKIEELITLNYLLTSDSKRFLELGIGFQKLFFRLDYVFGFDNYVYTSSGLRFGFLF